MQSTSIAPRHICHQYPIHQNPSLNSQSRSLHFSKKKTTHKTYLQQPPHLPTTNSIYYSLSSCSKEQEHKNHHNNNPSSPNRQTQPFLEQFYSSVETKRTQLPQTENQEAEEEIEGEGISTNMWWAEMKASIGQRINVDGLVCALAVVTRDRHLVIPHVSVKDVRHIDWAELKKNGFQGVVFDKDNTITAPYSLALWAPLGSNIEWCKSVFGDNIAVFSNSAGNYGTICLSYSCFWGFYVLRLKLLGCGLQLFFKGCCSCRQSPLSRIQIHRRNSVDTVLLSCKY